MPRCDAACLALVLAAGAWAGSPDFTAGDLYLLTHGYPDLGLALVRIDPVSGDTSVVHDYAEAALNPHLAYDPCRKRLVTAGPDNGSFLLVDAAGGTLVMTHGWSHAPAVLWAPVGDGRIYMMSGNPSHIGYVDAGGLTHDVLDTDGVTPFTYTFLQTGSQGLIYDTGTNSLFLTRFGTGTEVDKFPLTPDGTQLAGPMETATFDAFEASADEPVGLSAGPAGTLFIKIDTNSNLDGLRMFTVDPATLDFAPFAVIGHLFVAGNTAGTYNSVHGYGAALDTANDVIRTYVQSKATQEGVILATGVSGASSGESARLITIGDTTNGYPGGPCCCPADLNNDGIVGINDFLDLLVAWGPCNDCGDCPADLDGDCQVIITDLLIVLTKWGACY